MEFQTIYPGWYVSRDTHVHLKVHIGGASDGKKYGGGHICHTGQIAFPDELSDAIAKLEPYAQHKVKRVRHAHDMVFHNDVSQVLLQLKPVGEGYEGQIMVFVNPDATPKENGPGGGRPPGPPPGFSDRS